MELKTLTLWMSYAGVGAPADPGAVHCGYGRTKEEASQSAHHPAVHAPYERFRLVGLLDTLDPSRVSGEAARALAKLLPEEHLIADYPLELRDRAREAWRLARAGRVASAVLHFLGEPVESAPPPPTSDEVIREGLVNGFAKAKTEGDRRPFLRAALARMGRQAKRFGANDIEETCAELVAVLDASPQDPEIDAIERRSLTRSNGAKATP